MLREWHQRVLGSQAAHGHLQPGLIAIMAGIVLGLSGVALFLVGEATVARLAWRKAAVAMAAMAAPLIFGGISLALPGRHGLRILAGLGAAINAAAVGLFLVHYPNRFNAAVGGPDQAPTDAALYALGSALLAGTVLAQIVSVYVRGKSESAEDETWWSDGYEVPDWVIEKDIDDAMQRHPVEWGGAGAAASAVQISVAGFGADTVIRGQGASKTVNLKVPELETKSRRLRGLTASSIDVPGQDMLDATAALGELRRLQAENPRRYRPPQPPWWRRLLAWLFS